MADGKGSDDAATGREVGRALWGLRSARGSRRSKRASRPAKLDFVEGRDHSAPTRSLSWAGARRSAATPAARRCWRGTRTP